MAVTVDVSVAVTVAVSVAVTVTISVAVTVDVPVTVTVDVPCNEARLAEDLFLLSSMFLFLSLFALVVRRIVLDVFIVVVVVGVGVGARSSVVVFSPLPWQRGRCRR